MLLSQEIDIKLSQIMYTKICYKNGGLNGSYSANTQPIWKRRYPRGAQENLGLLLLLFEFNL